MDEIVTNASALLKPLMAHAFTSTTMDYDTCEDKCLTYSGGAPFGSGSYSEQDAGEAAAANNSNVTAHATVATKPPAAAAAAGSEGSNHTSATEPTTDYAAGGRKMLQQQQQLGNSSSFPRRSSSGGLPKVRCGVWMIYFYRVDDLLLPCG